MIYKISILRRAQKELADLPKTEFGRIRGAIFDLSENARPIGCKKLVGREGWRIKIGNYRVIYEIEDNAKQITVLHVGHRRDIYS